MGILVHDREGIAPVIPAKSASSSPNPPGLWSSPGKWWCVPKRESDGESGAPGMDVSSGTGTRMAGLASRRKIMGRAVGVAAAIASTAEGVSSTGDEGHGTGDESPGGRKE